MIFFYDFEFNLLLTETKVISWQMTKYYNEIGTFCARLPITSPAVKLVMENDFLVCRVGDEYAIVTGKEIGNELVIYGRTPNWLLSKRVVLPFEAVGMSTGGFVRKIFEEAYSDCENVVFGTSQKGSSRLYSCDRPKILSQMVFDILKAEGLGCEFVYDKKYKQWVFNLLKGEDKNLIVSEANKNAAETKITEDINDYANFCYYETEDDFAFIDDGKKGLYRFETYVLSPKETEAENKLSAAKKESIIDLEAVGVLYKKHYLLGDTLRVQLIKNDYKVTKRLKIRGVEMSSNNSGYFEKPIFEETETI